MGRIHLPPPRPSDQREEPGKPTANELYVERWNAGKSTGWTGFCAVSDYCTSPCTDCAEMGRRSDEVFRNDVVEHE